jgi:hypothetical protein
LDFEPNAFMLMSGKHQGYHLDIRINFTNRSTSKYSFAYSPSKFKTDYQPGCACAATLASGSGMTADYCDGKYDDSSAPCQLPADINPAGDEANSCTELALPQGSV